MRFATAVGLAVLSAVALSGQAVERSERILSTASRAFVSFEALMADIAGADVLFLNEHGDTPDIHRFEAAVLQALAGRREVVLALDVVDRAAQDPLEHFQMQHLSDDEFLAETKISVGAGATYLPLMKLAIARRWPIVATGPAKTGGEDSIAAALAQSITIGSTADKRPLLVSLHAGADDRVMAGAAELVHAQSPGRRAVVVKLVAAPSLEAVVPTSPTSASVGYVVYTATH